MKEKPILFSAEMVRAIVDGRKTQTRRVIKNPKWSQMSDDVFYSGVDNGFEFTSPYGQPGDRLWVRETWAANRMFDEFSPSHIGNDHFGLWWRADGASYRPLNAKPGRWRPSIHMPRWASRITLEVVDARVERLQHISDADAKAEGALPELVPPDGGGVPYTEGLRTLWDSINAKRGYGWESNPWVWVVEFKPVEE